MVLKRKKPNWSLYLWMVVEYSLDLKNMYMYFLGKHRENCFKIQFSKEKINIMKKFRLLKRKKKRNKEMKISTQLHMMKDLG